MFQNQSQVEFLAVVGPTASGKSAVAMELARHFGGEIVCCDSVQLYRGFDIGSAKPSPHEMTEMPHHLFSVLEWDEECDAAVYAQRAKEAIRDIRSRGRLPIITGGTGLYLRALVGQQWDLDLPKDQTLRENLQKRGSDDLFAELTRLDPERAKALHPNDRFRVVRALEINRLTGKPVRQSPKSDESDRRYCVVAMEPGRPELLARIVERTNAMLSQGLMDEVRSLLESGVSQTCKPMQSIGYFEVVSYLNGELSRDQLATAIEIATRQYAKRQSTWFKKIKSDFVLTCEQDLQSVVPQLRQTLS